MSNRKLKVRVTAVNRPTVAHQPASGWGSDAWHAVVTGEIRELIVSRNGKSQFGIHIYEDGSLRIMDCGNMQYYSPHNDGVLLVPTNPWPDDELG